MRDSVESVHYLKRSIIIYYLLKDHYLKDLKKMH